jgi:transposase
MRKDSKGKGAHGRDAKRAGGELSVVAGSAAAGQEPVPDPEFTQGPRRRRFTAEYKLRVLTDADACTEPGAIGALLRREGLYTSHLAAWRQQRDHGALAALGRSRGPQRAAPLVHENAQLRRRAERAEAELAKARRVIEVQGNVSALLGIVLEPSSAEPPETPSASARRSSRRSRNSRR